MQLNSDYTTEADPASRDQVCDLITSLALAPGEKTIAILSHAPQVYMQTMITPEETFALEFRDASDGRHFSVETGSRYVVSEAFLSYFDGTNNWKTRVEWKGEQVSGDRRAQPGNGPDSPLIRDLPDRDGLSMMAFTDASDLSCQAYAAELARFEAQERERLSLTVIDTAASPELCAEWGVDGSRLPIQIIFKDGVLQRVLRGVRSARALTHQLDSAMGNHH
ncbi:thioredoxin family protein [Glycomyces buryatensis]|uniref:Thioredoxin family protein n=1 Tax=Glycomyces buryatensis TaxID=2570927 RepID=A0A4S8Q0R5_9ACTN|nr:thioredoxin family protein [Glycomyces buryatensis]THV33664.1 thioredoxin family protein [Glycomyces buryatensis]